MNFSLLYCFFIFYLSHRFFCHLFLLFFQIMFYLFYLACQLNIYNVVFSYFSDFFLGFIIQIFITQYIFRSFKMVHFHIFPPDFHASSCYYYFCLNCHLLKRLHKKILIFPHFVSIFSIPLCKSIFSPTIIFLTPGGLPSKFLWCWLAKNKCLHFSHV